MLKNRNIYLLFFLILIFTHCQNPDKRNPAQRQASPDLTKFEYQNSDVKPVTLTPSTPNSKFTSTEIKHVYVDYSLLEPAYHAPSNESKSVCSHDHLHEITFKEKPISKIERFRPAREDPVIFSVNFDNDFWFETDYYYTNGIRFDLVHPVFKKSPLSWLLMPTFDLPETYYSLSLIQNMYTPTKLDTTGILYKDRPFSSYLLIGHNKISIDPFRKIKIISSLDIGIIGPGAMGGTIQDFIHNDYPAGWTNQIRNDLVVSYSCEVQKNLVSTNRFELTGMVEGRIGSLYNNAGAGVMLHYGNYSSFHAVQNFNTHLPANGNSLRYNIFAHGELSYSAYDATLQGGLFNHASVYTLNRHEVSDLTGRWSAGFALQYRWFSFQVEQVFVTPEFAGGRAHRWLHINMSFWI